MPEATARLSPIRAPRLQRPRWPLRRCLLLVMVALAGYGWTRHSGFSAVMGSQAEPPLRRLSLQQPGAVKSSGMQTAAAGMTARATGEADELQASEGDKRKESAAYEEEDREADTKSTADEASGAAAAARIAAENEAEPLEEQQAQEQDGYVPSPFETALRGCGSLSCVQEAHKQPKYPGQYNFPHFLLLGFPKCATTSLFHHLITHPQVMAPSVKEPEFFTLRCNNSAISCSPNEQQLYIRDTLHLNIALSARLRMAVFEGSTHYSLAGDWLAPELKQLMPWVKLVLSMREPISRAISMLQHNLDHKRFPKCYDRERRLIFKCIKANLEDSSKRYAPRLRAWVESFPPAQLHIMQYEDLTGDGMQRALREFKRFLGINSKLPSDDLGLHNSRRDNYTEGWPMTIRDYTQLVELARQDAEDVLSTIKQHGLAVASQWQQVWEHVWQNNLQRCTESEQDPKEHEALCMIPAT